MKKPVSIKQVQNKDTFKIQIMYKFKTEIKICVEILWLISNKYLVNFQLLEVIKILFTIGFF